MDTIRHVPLSRTLALHPGHSSQGQFSHRTHGLEQTPTHRDHDSSIQSGRVRSLVPSHSCRVRDTGHHVENSVTMNPLTGSPIPSYQSYIHHTHSLDCCSNTLSRNTNTTSLYPSRSLDNSTLHAYCLKNLHKNSSSVISNRQHTSQCIQCLPSYPEPTNALHCSYRPCETWHRQHTSEPKPVTHRRHSLPEPLHSSQLPKSSQPQPQPPQQLAQSSWLPEPQQISLAHWQPVTSEYLFPSTNSNSLASSHISSVTSAEDRRPEITTNSPVHQTCEAQSSSHELLSTLQSYRQQLVQQEQLSHQLHKLAADSAACPTSAQHVYLQLHNIRAIRVAIRAEVTYMEQLMAAAGPNSLGHSCVTSVISQMMSLLQQQSELCHDLETLTLASQRASPEPRGHCTSGQDPPLSHGHSSSQSVGSSPPQESLKDSATSPDPVKGSSSSLSSENHITTTTVISEHSRHNLINDGPSNHNVTAQDERVPLRLEEFSSTVAGAQKPCDTNIDTPNSQGNSSYYSLENDLYYQRSFSQESSNYSSTLRRQEVQLGTEPVPPPVRSASGAAEAHAIQSPDITGQVVELVRREVSGQTEGLQEQLHKQTRDVADIKDMIHLLINKLQ